MSDKSSTQSKRPLAALPIREDESFPFDLSTVEGQRQWTQWLEAQAQARIVKMREAYLSLGLADASGWTIPDEEPEDMRAQSLTDVATG